MFQFRAFPAYAYLIQRTIPKYCSGGFPHSEISGSQDICSSPKLIAACHVLRRLLMPRHSPCALYSLTFVDTSSISLALMFAPKLAHFAVSPLQITNASLVCDLILEIRLVLLNYAGNQQVTLQNCNCYPHLFRCSTINHSQLFFQLLLKDLSVALLSSHFNTLFSFQGASPSLF